MPCCAGPAPTDPAIDPPHGSATSRSSPTRAWSCATAQEVHLTKTEFRLLVELASSPGRVFSREVLLERVWGYGYFGDGRLVDVHVRRLRTKIEADPANPRHVVTVRGLGYKLQTVASLPVTATPNVEARPVTTEARPVATQPCASERRGRVAAGAHLGLRARLTLTFALGRGAPVGRALDRHVRPHPGEPPSQREDAGRRPRPSRTPSG